MVFTHTLFKSDKVKFERGPDDYRLVKCTATIQSGTLLLMEHCYVTSDIYRIANVIKYSSALFDNLYPRSSRVWNESSLNDAELEELCVEKAQKNMFEIGSNYVLGLEVSVFNHSSSPNAMVWDFSVDVQLEVPVLIMSIIAIRDMEVDDEVTIWYGSGYFGETKDVVLEPPSARIRDSIAAIVHQYLTEQMCKTGELPHPAGARAISCKTGELPHPEGARAISCKTGELPHPAGARAISWKDIALDHICVFYGLYVINEKVNCVTPRFVEYFEAEFQKEFRSMHVFEWIDQKLHVLSNCTFCR